MKIDARKVLLALSADEQKRVDDICARPKKVGDRVYCPYTYIQGRLATENESKVREVLMVGVWEDGKPAVYLRGAGATYANFLAHEGSGA